MFRRARFYNKLFTPVGNDQVTYTKLAISCYQRLIEYGEDNPEQIEWFADELETSRQVEDLLLRQLKIHDQQQTDQQQKDQQQKDQLRNDQQQNDQQQKDQQQKDQQQNDQQQKDQH